MGDRFDRLKLRHANVEALLRRPGIGHNNGPTFDMSWEAWVWRRASAKAWKSPSPEIAKMRVRRAERLGITYKELTASLMNTGANLGAAVMPLSLAARVRRGPNREIIVEARNSVAALVARSPSGQGAAYPVVETVQVDGICREVIAPAPGLSKDVAVEAEANERGERTVCLAPTVVNRLRVTRGPGESNSDVILRLAAPGADEA